MMLLPAPVLDSIDVGMLIHVEIDVSNDSCQLLIGGL